MPKITARFSVYSEDDNADINILKKKLLAPNDFYVKGTERLLTNGKIVLNKYTSYDYRYEFEEVFDLATVNDTIYQNWINKVSILKELKDIYCFKFSLDYEITIYGLSDVAMIYKPEFLAFLGQLGIQFSTYNYYE